MSNENKTHVVTKPNAKPATPIDQLRLVLANDYSKQLKNYFGGNKEESMRFMTSAIDYVRRVPKLLECDQMSLMVAFVQAAQLRLMPSGVGGEVYIIPYGREAKLQMGYQGMVTLIYRTEKVATITAHIIYQNDEFEYQEGLQPRLHHKPAMFGKPKGEPIGVYAIATMKDGSQMFKVMDKDAIMAIRNLSKAKQSKESPWNSDKDPELWMWKKTCLIQLSKLLPKTQDIQKAIETDYEGEGMDKMRLDAGGPAVAPANHRPPDTTIDPGSKTFGGGAGKESKPTAHDKQQKIDDDIPVIEECVPEKDLHHFQSRDAKQCNCGQTTAT